MCAEAAVRVCVRRRETGSGRLRNGLLGLVATVALVAAAWQTWGAEQHAGPVSLLQIELGNGNAKIVPSRDPKSLITAEVHGLSHVRQQLGSALGQLRDMSSSSEGEEMLGNVVGQWVLYSGL